MLRPGWSLARSHTSTFVDALLRADFAMRRHPSYAGAWPLPRPVFHRLEVTCLAGHAASDAAFFQKAFRRTLRFFRLSIQPMTQQKQSDCRTDQSRSFPLNSKVCPLYRASHVCIFAEEAYHVMHPNGLSPRVMQLPVCNLHDVQIDGSRWNQARPAYIRAYPAQSMLPIQLKTKVVKVELSGLVFIKYS